MLLDPGEIPAGSVGERVGGVTFYRVPARSQGPVTARHADGRRYLAYMYQSFLFVWFEHDATVHLYHGHIGGRSNLPLRWKLNIEEAWNREVLARRGREWVREHVSRFTGR